MSVLLTIWCEIILLSDRRVSLERITSWKDYFTGLRNAFIGTISFANTSVSPVSSMRSAGETES